MSEASRTSVTRLYGLGLTPGKLRGLQHISNANGTLSMLAADQNSAMIGLMKEAMKAKGQTGDPSFQEIVEAKVHLARCLAPHCSAMLMDGFYGVWNSVASFAIPRDVGVLVRIEQSGSPKNAQGVPLGVIEPGLSVGKIKRMGADAVKVLAPFEPTEMNSAEHQFEFVRKIYEDCRRHDILMLLEPISVPMTGEKKDSKSYLDRKAKTVIDSATYLSRYCDIFKAEFPGTMGHETDAQLQDNLKKLNDASLCPWVLLSAGVDYPAYKKQVEMAVKAGATGVLGGRAFWKEYFLQDGFEGRDKFARGECVKRVSEVDQIVKTQAKPWFKHYGLTEAELHGLRAVENWHVRYGGEGSGGSRAGYVEGDVY